MKDLFMSVLATLPEKEAPSFHNAAIKRGSILFSMDRVLGFVNKANLAKGFLEGCAAFTWIDFRRENVLGAMKEKGYFQTKQIAKVARLFKALGFSPSDITVYLRKEAAPAVFVVNEDDSGIVVVLAPCGARRIYSSEYNENSGRLLA